MRNDGNSTDWVNVSAEHLCYARWLARGTTFGLIPEYVSERNRLSAAVCVLEVAIIALAASNLFAAGH